MPVALPFCCAACLEPSWSLISTLQFISRIGRDPVLLLSPTGAGCLSTLEADFNLFGKVMASLGLDS